MAESQVRLTIGTMLLALGLVGSIVLWAGIQTNEVSQLRIEYGEVLKEVRELKVIVLRLETEQRILYREKRPDR